MKVILWSGLMGSFWKMYIEIAEDIVVDAIKKAGQTVNHSLDLLTYFALNVQKGKHIVYIPWLHNNPQGIKALKEVMGRAYVALLMQSERIYYQLCTIKSIVTTYAVITYSQNKIEGRCIFINPLCEKDFEPYNETKVITENLRDSKFFRYVVRLFMKEHAISQCKFSFQPIMGGGDTTADVLRTEIDERKSFCLVIADSDRKYPESCYGQTAQKILGLFQTCLPFNCNYYIINQVMEVENLIPCCIVKQYASQSGFLKIFELDPSFYDMKNGLTLNWLFDDDVCDYWRNMLSEQQTCFVQRDDAKINTTCRKDYLKYIEEKKYNKQIENGFGKDLLQMCTDEIDWNGQPFPPKIKERLMNITSEDLNTFQYNEWMNIGKILFSWTCGLTERRA